MVVVVVDTVVVEDNKVAVDTAVDKGRLA